jgi:hypothetical protein
MSAAVQFPLVIDPQIAASLIEIEAEECEVDEYEEEERGYVLTTGGCSRSTISFYREHTEKMLQRLQYASMLVGRAPSALSAPVARGWVSSRPVRSFEDAVIFVLDMEQCLKRMQALDRLLLVKLVMQEYTQDELSIMLRMSVRTMTARFNRALDKLTRILLETGLLILPDAAVSSGYRH